ncbi:hydroxyacid dehydrogenase [Gluconacetobacter tumulisoli]|uniref:Hydroxyacid dehydrogenase n=1 Tax=Gluconacetobacter tumulisoli TaxID=1286189 RepID=A0A7W4K9X2_9PROT|nr:hydroxyacid dehydrogenase [Gluconacetobacter tumulisoli]MBB2203041.1 hydroxyacid dehydrogenase [Gluconacetobacter tumulisoli]
MTGCFIVQPIHPDGVARLEAAGIPVRFASSPAMNVVAREIGSACAVITRDAGMDAHAIAAAGALRIIASHGAGVNRIDFDQARARSVIVTNTPGTNARSVAEYTIGLMLALARRIPEADSAVRDGNWDFRYSPEMVQLHGRCLGLVGFGAIAQQVARIARDGFGMHVAAWSPGAPDALLAQYPVTRASSLHALLAASDVVSLHRPLRPDTQGMIDDAALHAIKPGALLINTGRGALVDNDALRRALEDRRVMAAALDVFTTEPPAQDDPVRTMPRTLLTPHIGGTTEEALSATACQCAEQVIDCLAGRTPAHIVPAPIRDGKIDCAAPNNISRKIL